MFSKLSRGSSRVRQTYICSSCRCNILAHANPQPSHLPLSSSSQAASNAFSTSTPRLKKDDGDDEEPKTVASDPATAEDSKKSSDQKTAEPATGDDFQHKKKNTAFKGRPNKWEDKLGEPKMPISMDPGTLRKLRESLMSEPIQPKPVGDKPTRRGRYVRAAKKPRVVGKVRPKFEDSSSTGHVALSSAAADNPASDGVQEINTIGEGGGDAGGVPSATEPAPKKKAALKARKSAKAMDKQKKVSKPRVHDAALEDEIDDVPTNSTSFKVSRVKSKKEASNITAKSGIEAAKDGDNPKSWTVMAPDGRTFVVSKVPRGVHKGIEVTASDILQRKTTNKFLADNPTITEKLKFSRPDISATVLRNRLKALLQGDQLTDEERLPALRKMIELRLSAARTSATPGKPQNNSTSITAGLDSLRIKKKHSPLRIRRLNAPDAAGVRISRDVGRPSSPEQSGVSSSRGVKPKSRTTTEKKPVSTAHEIKTVNADDLHLTPLDVGPLNVPQLSYGLERVLFNPGVYQLQDPRSRVFNFDPYLQTIMPVSEFDFNALKQYITSSKDKNLLSRAIAEKKKYTGSTSSMTSALGHFHFLLSQWREITFSNLSKMFPVEFNTFTALQRGPVSIFLRWRDGAYAIDADKQFDSANILMSLGKSMEKLLTLPTKDFEKYRKSDPGQITEEERNAPEEFHYTGIGDFLLRSQLDAYDSRLPGTGMFDLKTRAVISIRMDTDSYEEGRGYEIRGRHGEWESFEREYYDMIRSAFLKYSLQVRMGRMDGIFVAFHNTERIFGFQYISLPEIDFALHGTTDTTLGDQEFKLSLDLLNRVLDRATAKYPEQSIRLLIETRPAENTPFTYIFAEPYTEEAIEEIQTTNKDKIMKFEKAVLGVVGREHSEEYSEEDQQKEWEKIQARVEESVGEDEAGREAAGNDDADLDSDLHDEEAEDDADEDEDLVEDDGATETDQVAEEAQELVDVISAADLMEDPASKEEGEQIIHEEEDNRDPDADESVEEVEDSEAIEEVEDSEATDPKEFVEDEPAEIKETDEVDEAEETDETDETDEVDVEDASEASEVEESEEPSASPHSLTKYFAKRDGKGSYSRGVSEKALRAEQPNGETKSPKRKPREMLGMTLTIRNKVNGRYVVRPEELTADDKWEVEHALSEILPHRVPRLYDMAMTRRSRALTKSIDLSKNSFNNLFLESIKDFNQKGREWRQKQAEIDKQIPTKVLDVNGGKKMSAKDHGLWTPEKEKGQERVAKNVDPENKN